METWFKLDSFDTTWQPIFYKGSSEAPNSATYSLSVSETGLLRLTSADDAGEENAETAPGIIQLGQWHHVAAIVDRITGNLKIYVDGEFEGPGSVRTTNAKSNDAPLLIGQTFENDPDYSPLNGSLNECESGTSLELKSKFGAI